MAYDFQNKTAREINDAFNAIVEAKGTSAQIDEAFDALKKAPADIQRRVVDDLEDDMVQKAMEAAAIQSRVTISEMVPPENRADEEADEELQQELQDVFQHIKPVVRAMQRIVKIKGDQAQPDTAELAGEISSMQKHGDVSPGQMTEALADVLEWQNEYNDWEDEDELPAATAANIRELLHFQEAETAIASLQAADSYTRERLVDRFEREFTGTLKASAEKARALTRADVPSDPDDLKDEGKKWQSFLAFNDYIVKIKGEAADPVVKAFSAEAARLPEDQRNDCFVLMQLPAVTLKNIADAEADRTAIQDSQQKLKILSQKRKARANNSSLK